VTFDPFGDFATRGYLRNIARTRDARIIRQLEHSSFTTGLDTAFANLAARKQLSYQDVLGTHKTLFEAVYPWAGEDRLTNAPGIAVSKGSVLFARPDHIRRAIDYALDRTRHSCWQSRARLWAILPMASFPRRQRPHHHGYSFHARATRRI
jgi:cell filamentation protein